jgi:hypothetical protein
VSIQRIRFYQAFKHLSGSSLRKHGDCMNAKVITENGFSLPFKGVEAGFRGAPLRAAGTGRLCKADRGRAGVGMG